MSHEPREHRVIVGDRLRPFAVKTHRSADPFGCCLYTGDSPRTINVFIAASLSHLTTTCMCTILSMSFTMSLTILGVASLLREARAAMTHVRERFTGNMGVLAAMMKLKSIATTGTATPS